MNHPRIPEVFVKPDEDIHCEHCGAPLAGQRAVIVCFSSEDFELDGVGDDEVVIDVAPVCLPCFAGAEFVSDER